jgi:uncharacterized protein with GYD domain
MKRRTSGKIATGFVEVTGPRAPVFGMEDSSMPKFLIRGGYSPEGSKGLLKGGGSARRDAVKQAVESVGGRLESFYFVLGADDYSIIVEAPDAESVAAVSLSASAAGGVRGIQTTLLLSPEEIDQASKKSVSYRPPGQ